MNLKTVFLDRVDIDLAPAGETSAVQSLDLKSLRQDVESVLKRNRFYFQICVVMVALLFLLLLGIVFTQYDKPSVVTGLTTACGVTVFGLIRLMFRLWREIHYGEATLMLAIHLGPETIKTVLTVFVKKL